AMIRDSASATDPTEVSADSRAVQVQRAQVVDPPAAAVRGGVAADSRVVERRRRFARVLDTASPAVGEVVGHPDVAEEDRALVQDSAAAGAGRFADEADRDAQIVERQAAAREN